jgi:3,4-dihydroxy 2-butanone 4-phosphate synthase/GTP cyclohydrolase II
MFPLRAHEAGVLGRPGHTEAGVDLTRLAGLRPAAVLCEIMAEDGTMARLPDLQRFAARHDLKLISIEALINYRHQLEREALVTRVDSAQLPTHYGHFEVTAYRDGRDQEHLLLRLGDLQADPPLVRLHSECLTGDVMGSLRCDCGEQLQIALERIGQDGQGALIYLRQEGRGIGLANKIRAYALQDQGLDTVEANICLGFPADPRNFAIAAAILHDQGVKAVRLMTNNPRKVADLETNQIEVVERVAHQVKARSENQRYLQTKAQKLNHLLVSEA